ACCCGSVESLVSTITPSGARTRFGSAQTLKSSVLASTFRASGYAVTSQPPRAGTHETGSASRSRARASTRPCSSRSANSIPAPTGKRRRRSASSASLSSTWGTSTASASLSGTCGLRLPPGLDPPVLGDRPRCVVPTSAADRATGVRGGAAEVDVLEGGPVGRVFVEGPKDAELVLRHLPVVPVAVPHARHPPLDVERAGDVAADDLLLLDPRGVSAPALEHGLRVLAFDLVPGVRPALAQLPRRDLLAERRRL